MVNEETQNFEPGQTGFRKAGFTQVIIVGLTQSQWFDQEKSHTCGLLFSRLHTSTNVTPQRSLELISHFLSYKY